MKSRSRALRRALLSTALLGCAASGLACWTASHASSPWDTWSTLRLKARAAAFLSGKVEMHLHHEGDKTLFETKTTAKFFGARVAASRTVSTLNSTTGRSESFVSLTKKRARRYEFGKTGYSVEKLLPVNGPEAPLAEWEVVSRNEFDYPTDEQGKPVDVFDYYGMLHYLRRTQLNDVGDEVTLHVATSRGPAPYRIVIGESRQIERTFEDIATGKNKTLTVREVRLRLIPADPEKADEGFLNMEGETELWVEAGSKTLLSLSGKAPKIPGRVRLELAAMG